MRICQVISGAKTVYNACSKEAKQAGKDIFKVYKYPADVRSGVRAARRLSASRGNGTVKTATNVCYAVGCKTNKWLPGLTSWLIPPPLGGVGYFLGRGAQYMFSSLNKFLVK